MDILIKLSPDQLLTCASLARRFLVASEAPNPAAARALLEYFVDAVMTGVRTPYTWERSMLFMAFPPDRAEVAIAEHQERHSK